MLARPKRVCCSPDGDSQACLLALPDVEGKVLVPDLVLGGSSKRN